MKRPALKTVILALALAGIGLTLAGCVYYPGYGYGPPVFYGPPGHYHGYHHDDD